MTVTVPWAHEAFGSGPVLVLGTSYLWDARMWQPQIEALAARWRIIVPLLPGHGNDVPLHAHPATPAELARQVGSLLDSLGVERFALAGLSVGGMWAAELALQRPHQVGPLLLMDTSLAAEPAPSLARYTALLDALEHAGAFPPALIEQVVPLFFRPGLAPEDPLRRAFSEQLAHWPAARIDAVVALGRLIFGRPERLQALRALDPARTWVAAGAHDVPRPPHEAVAMAEVIGCRCELIPDAGHIASLENPVAVTALLRAWLDETG